MEPMEEVKGDIREIKRDCLGKHEKLNEILGSNSTYLTRIDERTKNILDRLEDGVAKFESHENRIIELEKRQSNWKGFVAGVSIAASVVVTILSLLFKSFLDKMIKL